MSNAYKYISLKNAAVDKLIEALEYAPDAATQQFLKESIAALQTGPSDKEEYKVGFAPSSEDLLPKSEPEWTKEDSEAAVAEGWDIYYCLGSLDGPWQVQKNDEEGRYRSDSDVWVMIAQQEKPHHQKALEFLKVFNHAEYQRISALQSPVKHNNYDNS